MVLYYLTHGLHNTHVLSDTWVGHVFNLVLLDARVGHALVIPDTRVGHALVLPSPGVILCG